MTHISRILFVLIALGHIANAQRYSEDELDSFQKSAVDPVKTIVEQSQKRAEEIALAQAKEVSDPEAEKDGGPPTITVIKLLNGTTENSADNAALIMLTKIVTQFGVRIKEIKRGAALTSLVSETIPTGTKVFPIRIVLEGSDSSVTNKDLYFYKDEFGEWASIIKQ